MRFIDRFQREWVLQVNVASMRRAKSNGIDLSMPINQLREFIMDDVHTIDALWAIVSPNAKDRGITLEQFEDGFNGSIIEAARSSLFDALAEYYDPKKAAMLREAVKSIRAEMDRASQDIATLNGSQDAKANSATESTPTQ